MRIIGIMVMPEMFKSRAMAMFTAALSVLILALVVGVKPAPQKPLLKSQPLNKQAPAPAKTPEKTAAERYTFPAGGRQLLPEHRFVALYGSPDAPRLGVLGEQPVGAAVARVRDMAAQYQGYSTEKVWPTFEIITTIASASATDNGDYSTEVSVEKLRPWVDAAKAAGVYVVLDLQPGRTDFLTQAKQYEQLLTEPHVGLALDPEWRLKPDQIHLKQIGTVNVAEVNAVSQWLADLTARNKLPQKMLLLHQFRLSMISDRAQLDTSRKELSYVIQMDGNGAQPTKLDTWNTVIANAPANVYFGWKNFYDEDKPMLTPEATMLIVPKPWYVSYQ